MENYVHHSTPSLKDRISPLEKFSQVAVRPKISPFHHFGCPVYVLDNALTAGESLPKWEERARVGIYLGPSPLHARSVALILSLTIGLVSPQFHVVFDDHFQNVRKNVPGSLLFKPEWQRLAGFDLDTVPTSSKRHQSRCSRAAALIGEAYYPTTELEYDSYHEDDAETRGFHMPDLPLGAIPVGPPPSEPPPLVHPTIDTRTNMDTLLRRSNSIKRLPSRLGSYVAFESLLVPTEDIGLGIIDPIAFASTNPDALYYHQSMKAPDTIQFAQACVEEAKARHENGHWAVVPRSKIPSGTKIVPSVWAMKRKRSIATREIYKWKSRLNVHGGKQEYGVYYWERCSPVV